jgi:HEAT repeat protein
MFKGAPDMTIAITSIRSCRWVALVAIVVGGLLGSPVAAAGDETTRAAAERKLLDTLRGAGPEADKALACKLLAVHGSAAAVADLEPLLANERLASWARIALEAIPGTEAGGALRRATETLAGPLQVGPINSLGVRRETAAVPLLARLLAAPEADVAAAAAAALGRIGTPEAAGPLAAALATAQEKDAVAEACVLCAEGLLAAGDAAATISLYELVRQDAAVGAQRRAEATRGLIVARGVAGLPLLVESLRSPERRQRNIGLFTARELGRGPRPDAALAEAVDSALLAEVAAGAGGGEAGERAVNIVDVLAERNATASRPSVRAGLIEAAARGPKPLRLAAIDALGRIGDATAFAPLMRIAADPDAGIAVAVRSALARLPDAAVDRAISERLVEASAGELPLVVGLVADRRIDAAAALVPLVDHADEKVRLAAIEALGEVVDLVRLDVLTQRVLEPRDAGEAEAAGKALSAACVRMPDREGCAAQLAPVFAAATGPTKVAILEALGSVGGARALGIVAEAAKGGDAELRDAGTRLLGAWMTADAAPVLLELAAAEQEGKYRTRGLRGYLRIARQFVLPDAERAEMCRRALPLAREAVDRKAILAILTRYPSLESLAVVDEAAKIPGLEADAAAAAKQIRLKLAAVGTAVPASAGPWLSIAGQAGPGKGKRVVLVSGDEEYRSEEALTQLAKILATHHGFDCTVLYAIDPATGTIAPDQRTNIPGLEALRTADLMVIATRFRNLPDAQMKEIDDYLRSGRPVIGLRTATHAFAIPSGAAYHRYSWDHAGEPMRQGFGREVLGETWISHHGGHGTQSTRGILAPGAKDHPILRGIADGDIWGPTDVYGVRLPLPGDSRALVLGQVLAGMKPADAPVSGGKNDPPMPVAWTKTSSVGGGPRGRVFTTTMGAATDLESAGLRRLLVNACYWAVGLEERIPERSVVDVVGRYEPRPFGAGTWKPGVKPADLR